MLCPCGSNKPYTDCCARYVEGNKHAPTAEALMRSRYTAYTFCAKTTCWRPGILPRAHLHWVWRKMSRPSGSAWK